MALGRGERLGGSLGVPGNIRGASRKVVVVVPPLHMWRGEGKPGSKGRKGDEGARSEGQTSAGGDKPGDAPGTLPLHFSPDTARRPEPWRGGKGGRDS